MAYFLTVFLLLTGNGGVHDEVQHTKKIQEGLATYYDPGLIEQVYQYRLSTREVEPCPECLGFVALLGAEDIGEKVYLSFYGEDFHGPYLVVDCAAQDDKPNLMARSWLVDVGYEIARRWGINKPTWSRLLRELPLPEYIQRRWARLEEQEQDAEPDPSDPRGNPGSQRRRTPDDAPAYASAGP